MLAVQPLCTLTMHPLLPEVQPYLHSLPSQSHLNCPVHREGRGERRIRMLVILGKLPKSCEQIRQKSHNPYFSLILSGQPLVPLKSLRPPVKPEQLLEPSSVQPFLLYLCHSVQPHMLVVNLFRLR